MQNLTPVEVVSALAWFEYNHTRNEMLLAAYGEGHHHIYLTEKGKLLAERGFLCWYGTLDLAHRERLVTAIVEAYGDDARKLHRG